MGLGSPDLNFHDPGRILLKQRLVKRLSVHADQNDVDNDSATQLFTVKRLI